MAKEKVAIGTWPTPEVVQVQIPAKVAYDLKSMQKATEIVLGRLGCPECHSGWDIRFEIENRYRFDNKLKIR